MKEKGFKHKLTAILRTDKIGRDKCNLKRSIFVLPLSISCILYLLLEGIYPKVCFSHDILVPIHQYIALEAREVWKKTPDEIKNHMHTDFNSNLDNICEVTYDSGDDIITGSAEEDLVAAPLELIADILDPDLEFGCLPKCDDEGGYFKHFWDPDQPSVSGYKCNTTGGGYNRGLVLDNTNTEEEFKSFWGNYDSAYRLAQDYWDRLVIPYYTGKNKNGQPHPINKERAYYGLGRVAHLLTDMCVPAHVHNDPHSPIYPHGDDSFEDYMKEPSRVYQFEGSFYAGEQYNYEELKWEGVHEDKNPPNLFWLFWYVAQKTQYFASDGNTGKDVTPFMGKNEYTKLDGTKVQFSPILWQKEITKGDIALDDIITNPYDLEYPFTGLPHDGNLWKVANALIPHAMKAVTGLYRLFWIETHPKSNPISPILLLLLSDKDNPPVTSSQWAIRYGGLYYESIASSVQNTSDGGHIVAGETSFGAGTLPDMWVLKINTDGSLNWQKSYGGNFDDSARSIQQTADGGYIMAGWGLGSSCWVLKLNAYGSITWQKKYSKMQARFIIQTLNQQRDPDGYIMTGIATGTSLDPYGDIGLLRLSLNGSAMWQNAYGGSYADRPVSIQKTVDQNGSPDGYVIVGDTESFNNPPSFDPALWILRLNLDGSAVWQKAYSIGFDAGRSIQQTFDQQGKPNGFIVGGVTDFDFWVLRLENDGSINWQMAYGGTERDELYDIHQTQDGGFIVAGDTWSFGAGSADAWLLKLSSNGTIEWQKTYGGSAYDSARSVQQIQDGGYVMTGETSSFGAPNSDVWLLKLNSDGEIPGCSAMGDSQANVYQTSAATIDTNAVPREIQPSTTDTVVLPQNTSAEITELCAFP